MILRRLGNKKKIAAEIQKHFPPHKIYIEPFFGAGGMFFNKPKARYNIVNDLDSDVFNLFQVVMNQKEELEKAFYLMPIHSDLLDYWKKNKEVDPIKKALRFLFLSNFTIMGSGQGLRIGASRGTNKNMFFDNLDKTFDVLVNVQLNNKDFKKFLASISWDDRGTKGETNDSFIYNDPPYLGTTDNYSNSFTEQDSFDLFEANEKTGCKWAMSEFDNPFISQQAKERNLNVIVIGERQNLKNRRTEILITNYKSAQLDLFNQ
jgi:DNA adenine methylase